MRVVELVMKMIIVLKFFKHRAGAAGFIVTAVLVNAGHSAFALAARLAKR